MNAAAERATIILDIETSWYLAQRAVALYQLVPKGPNGKDRIVPHLLPMEGGYLPSL